MLQQNADVKNLFLSNYMKTFKLFLLLILFSGCMSNFDTFTMIRAKEDQAKNPHKEILNEEIRWSSYDSDVEYMSKSQCLLIFFSRHGCKSCNQIEEILSANKEVKHIINYEFIPVMVRGSDRNLLELLSKFNVEAPPTVLILNDNKELVRLEGPQKPKNVYDKMIYSLEEGCAK